MKVIDEYQTPDGRHKYRIEDDEGNILPPMSFPEKQTKTALASVINKFKEVKEKSIDEELITITKSEYDDLKIRAKPSTRKMTQ